jgi:hypothetical protein
VPPDDIVKYVEDNPILVDEVLSKPMGQAELPKDVRNYTTIRENSKEMYEKLCKKCNMDNVALQKVASLIYTKHYKKLNKSSRQAHVMLVTDFLTNCYLHEAGAGGMRLAKKLFKDD